MITKGTEYLVLSAPDDTWGVEKIDDFCGNIHMRCLHTIPTVLILMKQVKIIGAGTPNFTK